MNWKDNQTLPVGPERPVPEDPVQQPEVQPYEAVVNAPVTRIGPEQLRQFMRILEKYKSGKAQTETRIISAENWWKLHNTIEEQQVSSIGMDGGFVSKSGWMHNVITSKHADAMESYPEPNFLPREESDKEEARRLSKIVPCVLEQNKFEKTYSDAMWQKTKFGTGVYKVIWDQTKLNGLGDIAVETVSLLNLYWEPGITDIQKSRFIFQTELVDKDILEEIYPNLRGKLKGRSFFSAKFLYDDNVDTSNKLTIVEVYYHKNVNGRNTLQYCKFVGDQVLDATENDPVLFEHGLYDHGRFPYVFDALYPIEGSPCGYGYVDVCCNPQIAIDILNTAMLKNAAVGALPRFLTQQNSNINESEFLDTNNPIVHVAGDVSENSLRQIQTPSLDGAYLTFLDRKIQELRENSGNTEASTGNIQSGVTAASAIAALQEASGKGSRDSTLGSYRSYGDVCEMCVELIRQFYHLPRQFRILGENGADEYVSYTNANLQPQHQGNDFGQDMGYRRPVFDIKITAQKKNVYTKVAQNELALQFFQLGFFNPQMTDQALMCLEMMEFDGKEGIMQRISNNGTMMQKLQQYMQMALSMAQVLQPQIVPMIMQDMARFMVTAAPIPAMGAAPKLFESDNIAGIPKNESAGVEHAREKSNAAAQPHEAGAVRKEAKK